MHAAEAHPKFTSRLLCALVLSIVGLTSNAAPKVHFIARLEQTIPYLPCPIVVVPLNRSSPLPPPQPCPPPFILHAGTGWFTLSSNSLVFYLSFSSPVQWYILIRKPSGQEIPIAACPMYDNDTPVCTPSGVLELSYDDDVIELLAGLWYIEARLLGPYDPLNLPSPIFGGYILPVDNDDDGVPDFRDACANTPAGVLVNADGCSIEQLCPCADPWKNHGEYVTCMQRVTTSFREQGLITPATAQALTRDAASIVTI